MAKNVAMGATVRDRLTGFSGIVVGRTTWISGCDRIGVHRGLDKDGKVTEIEWIDEPRLEVVSAPPADGYLDVEPPRVARAGGDREEGRRSFDPPSR